jgi:protein-tyrosine phosphatase
MIRSTIPLNANEILPYLYVGSCTMTAEHIDQLQRLGISAVLNLQTDDDFEYWGIDWPGLLAAYAARGIVIRRATIVDFDVDSLRDNLPACVRQLQELIEAGHTVYVHCTAGINRSPSTVIAYLHWVEGHALSEAVRYVTTRRDCEPYVQAIESATELWKAQHEDRPENQSKRF